MLPRRVDPVGQALLETTTVIFFAASLSILLLNLMAARCINVWDRDSTLGCNTNTDFWRRHSVRLLETLCVQYRAVPFCCCTLTASTTRVSIDGVFFGHHHVKACLLAHFFLGRNLRGECCHASEQTFGLLSLERGWWNNVWKISGLKACKLHLLLHDWIKDLFLYFLKSFLDSLPLVICNFFQKFGLFLRPGAQFLVNFFYVRVQARNSGGRLLTLLIYAIKLPQHVVHFFLVGLELVIGLLL